MLSAGDSIWEYVPRPHRETHPTPLSLIREAVDRANALFQGFEQRPAPAAGSICSDLLVRLLVGLGKEKQRGVLGSEKFLHRDGHLDFPPRLELAHGKIMDSCQLLTRIRLRVPPILHFGPPGCTEKRLYCRSVKNLLSYTPSIFCDLDSW